MHYTYQNTKSRCGNCGQYDEVKYVCKCGEEYCDACECHCKRPVEVYLTACDYQLSENYRIDRVYFVTDTFDTFGLVVFFGGIWFHLVDDDLLKETMQTFKKWPVYFTKKEWKHVAEKFRTFPTVKGGDLG